MASGKEGGWDLSLSLPLLPPLLPSPSHPQFLATKSVKFGTWLVSNCLSLPLIVSLCLSVSGDKTCKVWDVAAKTLLFDFLMGTTNDDMQVGCLWQGESLSLVRTIFLARCVFVSGKGILSLKRCVFVLDLVFVSG